MSKILKAFGFLWRNISTRVWLIVASIILLFAIAVPIITTQNVFISNTLNTVFGAQRRVLVKGDPSLYEYYKADGEDFLNYKPITDLKTKKKALQDANNFNEKIAEEGFVLLKNEGNALPLAKGAKVSVFGKNSVNMVYGGSGSGAGNSADAIDIYDSLKDSGFKVNPKLKSFYENNRDSGKGRARNPGMKEIVPGYATGETPQNKYTDAIKKSYSEYKDAALVVISRIGGEGFDLPRSMSSTNDLNTPIEGAEKATDHYLQLDKNEKDLLDAVSKEFDKVVLIINSSAAMELGFLKDNVYPNLKAALWIGSPGGTGAAAIGRILNGEVNPSGRLVDTYARNFKDDPTWHNFGNNLKFGSKDAAAGNQYMIGNAKQDYFFVEYEEGIYVGYRYYETRGFSEKNQFGNEEWYGNNVVYPFGYGLSYTSFNWEIVNSVPAQGGNLDKNSDIAITVRVTNTGTREGMDVVQLYYSAPYYEGEIEKAHVALGGFEKTGMIAPGKYQDITIKLNSYDMASYDYSDANGNGFKGYELEDGEYKLYIGRNANDAWTRQNPLAVNYYVSQQVESGNKGYIYSNDPTTKKEVENRFDDVSNHIKLYLKRSDWNFSMPKAPTEEERKINSTLLNALKFTYEDKEGAPGYTTEMPSQGVDAEEGDILLYKLINFDKENGTVSVDYNDTRWEALLNSLTIQEMASLIGTGNFNTIQMAKIGKPRTTDPDGPAGFTNFMGDPTVYGTCFYASECVIGATWSKIITHDMGIMVGIEGIFGNQKGDGRPYSGWYAPAMNIHRSPFSGRNFEYYSEDAVLSGVMGANVIKGAKKKGVYTYVKHFALNDQETSRDSNGLVTWANEQSMREIYLKAFEIAVKDGKTTAIMSSFNRIGTVWAGGSYALLTEILRNEWGFKGMVISDYNLSGYMNADQMIRAGGDLNLTQNKPPQTSSAALTPTQVSSMRKASKNILYTVAQSNAMNGIGEGVEYKYVMPLWKELMIIIDCSVLALTAAWGVLVIIKAKKKGKKTKI